VSNASMADLRLGLEERRGPIDILMTWLPRVAIAIAFVSIGSTKFASHSMWGDLFAHIGLGQWFRYFTGTVQIIGGCLVLIPRAFVIGIALLACTMIGAMAAWVFVLDAPFNAVIPGVILIALAAVGAQAFRA
jgi:putative oxidoreductase